MGEGGSVGDEAKGLVDSFVKTVGITDIVLGALVLYGLRLAAPTIASHFVSTGHEFADNCLLVCGAAFVGKVVNPIACAFLLLPVLPTYRCKIREEVKRLERAAMEEWNAVFRRALTHFEARANTTKYERTRDNAVLCYGAGFVLAAGGGFERRDGWWPVVLGAALLFSGWLFHNVSMHHLGEGLGRLPDTGTPELRALPGKQES
jgi:hypothetical protein